MIKRVFKLFQIARKLSTSGAIDTINQVHQIPLALNLFFNLISIGSESNRLDNKKKSWRKTLYSLARHGNKFYKTWAVFSYQTRYYR